MKGSWGCGEGVGSVTSSSDIDGVVFLEDVNVSFQLLHEALETLLLLALVFRVGDEGKALVVVVRHLPILLQTEQHFLETDESAVRISLSPGSADQASRKTIGPSDLQTYLSLFFGQDGCSSLAKSVLHVGVIFGAGFLHVVLPLRYVT